MATGDLIALKHIQVFKRPGDVDLLFGWVTRTGTTDALVQWNGSGWTVIFEQPGTDLIYDSREWISKLFWCDGKNGIWYLDLDTNIACLIDTAPPVQYLEVFQERLVGAGDARNKAEIEALGKVWPADCNRDRVLFSEAIDFNRWSPNNFIDAQTGTGEIITGLGVNSVTSAERGAQSQLVVFKPSFTMINDGVLASGDQRLNFVSSVIGAPGYHSICRTPFGLMFCSRESVCRMHTDGSEPEQVGFYISPDISATKDDFTLQRWQAAIFHNNTYKLSVPLNTSSTKNDREWWLDLRPQIFPNEQLWYGPMTGDNILQYAVYNGVLVAAEQGTTHMWKVDVEGVYGSMSAVNTPRTSTMTWPRLANQNMARGKLDAYGFKGIIDSGVPVALSETVDYERGVETSNQTLTVPARTAVYNVTRPVKRNSYDAQVTISHSADSDIEVHSVYVRGKTTRRQSEKEDGSTQS